ncbi:hypothetical protein NL108_007749 [Boleophthalmus pectinirostris]|uniref:cell surface glycoprotein CD200 receptor 1-A isoform X2 n=1 Tax=Boleophthalmus pectinirostris TaxID=150288 RepID=UPI000A1C704D|nr:cell surface glycoprotein CD200 receptor 1-A isoform X2 [Boleophthalmus pectinirostris]KAJ0070388.1 hypothetical protein NL108_007749 [Boleophthalmus pectinirostris]
MLLLHVALVVLVSEAWGDEKEVKFSSFRLGEEAKLTCGDVAKAYNTTIYVIWTLKLQNKECHIRCDDKGDNEDTCKDKKALRNSTDGQLILHIPQFSYSDVGNYSCDYAYEGGSNFFIHVINITAPPIVSSLIEERGDRRVVVCRAERASPAANISWTVAGNVTTKTEWDPDGLVTVESSVEVNTLEEAQNLSCTITHPYWNKSRNFRPNKTQILKPNSISQAIRHLAVRATIGISVVFCLALLFLAVKKVIDLRMNQRASKPSRMDDVEEVEPYASYVQRVNSIYN